MDSKGLHDGGENDEIDGGENDGIDGGDCKKLIIICYNPLHHMKKVRKLHRSIFSYSKESIPSIYEMINMKGYVGYIDNKIAGYLLYTTKESRQNVTNISYVYIDYIGVNPNYQSQGIGKMLMKYFTDFANTKNYTTILEVERDTIFTTPLIGWYVKNGFRPFMYHFEDGVNLVSMIRSGTSYEDITYACELFEYDLKEENFDLNNEYLRCVRTY